MDSLGLKTEQMWGGPGGRERGQDLVKHIVQMYEILKQHKRRYKNLYLGVKEAIFRNMSARKYHIS